jgi:hypothetical protein
MTDREFREFALLWSESDAAEQEAMQAVARRVRRKGRLLGYSDLALAVLLIGGAITGAVISPTPTMIAIVLVGLVFTIWLSFKRRAIRQMATTLDTGDRASFLASSVRVAKANLRRVTLSLIIFPPAILVGAAFKLSLRHHGRLDHPVEALLAWAVSTRGIVSLSIIAVIAGFTFRSRLKIKAELRRLEAFRRDYATEARRDEADIP